ncbi:putative hemolysin [Acetobacter sp.]|uniref:putative hemolysin n=1 Tax=Acetobacter sp. TaxID=440 RepID=UPI0025B956DE|nr:DUF333 domain-containing protein [Acetobacter sp.]
MTYRKIMMVGASALLVGAVSACAADSDGQTGGPPKIGMANPASVYCQKIGGRLEFRRDAEGVHGICHLPDGTSMEEWALFRRDHPRAEGGKAQ